MSPVEPAQPPLRRVLVTGSVSWSDPQLIETVLDELLAEARAVGGSFRLLTGMAEGADLDARRWAGANGVPVLAEPLEQGEYPVPMHRYNDKMLSWHPDLVLAFKKEFAPDWASDSCVAGTEHMCRVAVKAGVPVLVNCMVPDGAGELAAQAAVELPGAPSEPGRGAARTGLMSSDSVSVVWNNTVVRAVLGDITQIQTDVIVNAANSSLLGGGGVDGAIHRAAGPALLDACRDVRAATGQCATGDAVITVAGNLPADWVVHTVGPVWQEGRGDELDQLLADCYTKSMALADSKNASSIAFPNISTGVYRYPLARAAQIAIGAVRGAVEAGTSVGEILFVCFEEENLDLYRQHLAG